MVLVFLFVGVIILIIILTVISRLKITVEELVISNEIEDTPILKVIDIKIGIYALNKFRIYEKKINKSNIQKMKNSKRIEKIKNKFLKKANIDGKKINIKADKDIIKQLNLKLEEFNLNINIGTQDVVLTSFLICIISIIVSILLSKSIEKYTEEKYKYIIMPNYDNKNSIKIILSGILSIKLVNIINMLFRLFFRGGVNDERTSNRRTYDNCNEQYSRNDRCKYNYR